LNREDGLELVSSKVKNDRLVKHMLAVEAVMRGVARRMGEDEDRWALTGLIHDLDYDETAETPEQHGKVGAEYLRQMDVDEDIVRAVESHVGLISRDTPMERALYAADPLTGLVVAAALMHPSKSLSGLDVEFVLNRFKEKRFAAGADRDQIRSCEDLGLDLEEFVGIGLKSMQDISDTLGL
jgi:putative nucleotidyltransferase with HDIG domain